MARFALGPQKMQSPGVDLASTQTITGPKSFIQTAAVGQEVPIQVGSSDSPMRLFLENGSSSSGVYFAQVRGIADGKSLGAVNLLGERDAAVDTAGGPPVVLLWPRRIGGGSLTASNLFGVLADGRYPMLMGPIGDVTYNITAQTGVAEECARWTVSNNTSSYARIMNGTSSDTLFFPEIGGYVTSTSISALTRFSSELAVDAATPAGAMVFQSRIGSAASPTALANRTPFVWLNGPNVQMALTPAGSLQILTANAGLQLKAGTRARRVTLSGGTVTIADASVTANTLCLSLVRTAKSGTLGHVDIAFTAGVGYTVTSTSGTENSTFDLVLGELIP